MKYQNTRVAGLGAARGLSLVEVLIAMLLGLVLMSAMVSAFLEGRRQSHRQMETARLQQHGRYALELLQRELLMAGFQARWIGGEGVSPPPAAPDCGVATDWSLAPLPALGVIADVGAAGRTTVRGAALSCLPGPGGVLAGSDVLAVKRSAAEPTLEAGRFADAVVAAKQSQWYLRLPGEGLSPAWRYVPEGGNFPAVDRAASAVASYWESHAAIYFIRPFSSPGDGLPTLCVERLSANSMGPVECLVEGVEDLQIAFGIDADGDGVAERFTGVPDAAALDSATLARLTLRLRSLNRVPGEVADGYLRQTFHATVLLRNNALFIDGGG
ncbi:MAG: PilW family protein [Parahaliea sp.]